MRDDFGDKITVEAFHDAVFIDFHDGNDHTGTMCLSPKRARKLVRKIQRAASAIEINERTQ